MHYRDSFSQNLIREHFGRERKWKEKELDTRKLRKRERERERNWKEKDDWVKKKERRLIIPESDFQTWTSPSSVPIKMNFPQGDIAPLIRWLKLKVPGYLWTTISLPLRSNWVHQEGKKDEISRTDWIKGRTSKRAEFCYEGERERNFLRDREKER